HWRKIFERSGREVFDKRFQIIEALGIQPGMRIADVGAGTGLYTMLFARAVGPAERVYAVDISESFVEAITKRATEYHVDNVVPVVNDQQSTELPPESVDLVFLADTYHHFEYPKSMLASIHQALVPSGVLAIIDFRRLAGVSSSWVMGHVRAGRAQVIEEIQVAGFRFEDEPLNLRGNYFLRFRKVDS
ncbi:MAG: methyltransferase domain-containing protein, partial [Thiohalocapsa sp.]